MRSVDVRAGVHEAEVARGVRPSTKQFGRQHAAVADGEEILRDASRVKAAQVHHVELNVSFVVDLRDSRRTSP